jgi:hypothetical protein
VGRERSAYSMRSHRNASANVNSLLG